jgi:hypothetical protein
MKTAAACSSVVAALAISSSFAVRAESDPAEQAMSQIRAESIRANMRFLADDRLEGRATGSRGHELAAMFVAAQFEQLGLQPAGDEGSYFQSVPFRSSHVDEAQTALTLIRGGKEETLVFRQDFLTSADATRADSSVEAPVVYVGGGVTAPELKYDDYAGVDVKGKIVALIAGAPATFESSVRAEYSSFLVKGANAVAHGAVGTILVADPVFERIYGFERRVRDLGFAQLRWLDREGRPDGAFPELKGRASLNMAATERLFAGGPHSVQDVYAAAAAGKPLSFELPVKARIRNVTRSEDIRSPNIAAKLEGSDPKLKGEYVVYTAHIDHVGVGAPVQGDRIYNGALDNASGTSLLVELARAFSQMNPRPKRSILFVAVTGEEAGLLGSDYFARFPTVPKDSIVANINMDQVLMLWPMRDVVAFGADHSSLGAVVKEAARRMNFSVGPDPMPEAVVFIRSDQYSFVKQGIPAIMATIGQKSEDPGIVPGEILSKWFASRYHQPQDDMEQPLEWDTAVQFARFNLLCGYLVAQAPERPTWNKGDFFGDRYGKKAR